MFATTPQGFNRRTYLLLALPFVALMFGEPARADHRVLWRVPLEGYSLGRTVDIGPDGTLYTSDLNRLYAVAPDGEVKWTLDGVGFGRPVSFGIDGTIYTGGSLVAAINPDGTLKWRFENPRPGLDLAAGPNVGPDGNIYAAQDTGGDPNALGVFALNADGELIWSTGMQFPMIDLRGPSITDILFAADRMYITIYRRLSRPPTIRAYSYDGDLIWYSGDLELAVGGSPQIHPNGDLIMPWAQVGAMSLTPDGAVNWITDHPGAGSLVSSPSIAADGTIYVGDWLGVDWWAFNEDGATQWVGPSTGSMLQGFDVTPDGTQLIASGAEQFGVPGWVRSYDPHDNGQLLWQVELPSEGGLNQFAGTIGAFSDDSRTAYLATWFAGDADYGYLLAIDLSLDLDCDEDGVLDIHDNCVCTFNPDQIDADADGIGDACDSWIPPDHCEDALPLCPGTVQGNSLGATNDGTSSCSPNPLQNRDVWYAYTPAADGTVTVDGCGAAYSYYLSAHTDCPGDVANELDCALYGCPSGPWPQVTFDAVAGETYYIRVNGFNAVEMTSYTLTLDGPDCQVDNPLLVPAVVLAQCLSGPDLGPVGGECAMVDFDVDGDVDMDDYRALQSAF